MADSCAIIAVVAERLLGESPPMVDRYGEDRGTIIISVDCRGVKNVGRFIGSGGRTIRAVRDLVDVVGRKNGLQLKVEVLTTEAPRERK